MEEPGNTCQTTRTLLHYWTVNLASLIRESVCVVVCVCSKQVRCSQTGALRCDQECGAQLNCKQHCCTQICHQVPCQPCQLSVQQGKFTQLRQSNVKRLELLFVNVLLLGYGIYTLWPKVCGDYSNVSNVQKTNYL